MIAKREEELEAEGDPCESRPQDYKFKGDFVPKYHYDLIVPFLKALKGLHKDGLPPAKDEDSEVTKCLTAIAEFAVTTSKADLSLLAMEFHVSVEDEFSRTHAMFYSGSLTGEISKLEKVGD